MTRAVTFLGGPWDMHRVMMEKEPPPTWLVPVRVYEDGILEGSADPARPGFNLVIYKRLDIPGSRGNVTIYVFEEWL